MDRSYFFKACIVFILFFIQECCGFFFINIYSLMNCCGYLLEPDHHGYFVSLYAYSFYLNFVYSLYLRWIIWSLTQGIYVLPWALSLQMHRPQLYRFQNQYPSQPIYDHLSFEWGHSYPFWVLTDDLEAVNQTVNDIFEVLILHNLAMVLTLDPICWDSRLKII